MVMVTWVGVAIITAGAEGIIAAGDTTTDDFYGEGRLIGGPPLSVREPFKVARIARGDASIAGPRAQVHSDHLIAS